MFFNRKKKSKEVEVQAFFEGEVIPLEEVKDPMFAEKVMGDGVAIKPQNGKLYAPITGKVTTIFDTKHAIGFVLENGAEILMHIGMDTVELAGEGFDLDIKVGDTIKAGDFMGNVDIAMIESSGKETVTPILLTNMDEYKIEIVKKKGSVKIGDILYKITK